MPPVLQGLQADSKRVFVSDRVLRDCGDSMASGTQKKTQIHDVVFCV